MDFLALAVRAALPGLVASPAMSQTVPPGAACEKFVPPPLENGATFSRVSYLPPSGSEPARCVVKGSIVSSPTSTINFRVDLPDPGTWNAKLLMVGGGGFDGSIMTDVKGRRPRPSHWDWSPYVLVSTDSGHQSRPSGSQLDFSWAAGNPTALRNHSHQANHLTLWTAVSLAKAYYGRAPARRYIVGTSNGGRSGLMAAQRYPKDYHGIIANAPAISQLGFVANLTPVLQHIFAHPDNWLSPSQVKLYERAEIAACDGLDGLDDGVIANVSACRYDPAPLLCRSREASSETCLTPGQVESARLIVSGRNVDVALADNVVGYPGYGRGSASDWRTFFFGTSFAARDAINFILADNVIKHGITNDPNASVMTHDPAKWRKEYLALSTELDTTNPDLSAFFEAGGKLIVWHGLADACVTHARTAEYLDRVSKKIGAAKFRKFVRFYTSLSGHAANGPGADIVDLMAPLSQWVEQGIAPGNLVAERRDSKGVLQFARPLCQFPQTPRYKGTGDPRQASSFTCESNQKA